MFTICSGTFFIKDNRQNVNVKENHFFVMVFCPTTELHSPTNDHICPDVAFSRTVWFVKHKTEHRTGAQ